MVWGEETIGQRIQRERESRGWTQAELGRHTGLSERAINHVEKDIIRDDVHKEIIERIADAFKIPVEQLRRGETHAEKATKKELQSMIKEGFLTQKEADEVFSMAGVRFRANAKMPLSRMELLALLEVRRGS